MSRYRVMCLLEVDVDAGSPEEAAAAARVRFDVMLPFEGVIVSEDDGSQWNEVGRFLLRESRS